MNAIESVASENTKLPDSIANPQESPTPKSLERKRTPKTRQTDESPDAAHECTRKLPIIRILVVDDDVSICEYMRLFLERDGYLVSTVVDPLSVASEVQYGNYNLVILDLMMPKLDGLEVLEQIRGIDSDIAVVIFTGYPNLETAVASMKLDAIDYVRKPFNIDEFREVIERVLRKKGISRTPEEQLHRAIGDSVRLRRKGKRLTLKQMSSRTGLSMSLLSQIERAESSASLSSLFKIASALDLRVHELFGEH